MDYNPVNKVGFHEPILIERSSVGDNDKALRYNQMPTKTYGRNDGIRKIGNSHNNNELNQEMSMDAKTCE